MLSRADAMKLVDEIRRARVAAFAIADRVGRPDTTDAAFLGGLESVLQHFLHMQRCHDAAKVLPKAMNHLPTAEQIAARGAELARIGRAA